MTVTYLFLAILSIFTSVEQDKFTLEKEFDISADFITTDRFGNLYSIVGPRVSKFDPEKNQKTSYSNLGKGKITSADVSDPFRILLYYKDFNNIVFLNKSLSEIISPISLDNLGFFNVAAACQSANGGFWIFDQSFNQLVYINDALEIMRKSAQLSGLFDTNSEVSQVLMLEKNDYIYLGINGESILLFDNYGTYIKTFPIAYDNIFQVNNGVISYNSKDKICFYSSHNYNENCTALPKQNCIQALIENNKLFIQVGKKVCIYRIEKN